MFSLEVFLVSRDFKDPFSHITLFRGTNFAYFTRKTGSELPRLANNMFLYHPIFSATDCRKTLMLCLTDIYHKLYLFSTKKLHLTFTFESHDQKISTEFKALPKTGIRIAWDGITNLTHL